MKPSSRAGVAVALCAPLLVLAVYAVLLRPTWTTQIAALQRDLARWQAEPAGGVPAAAPVDAAALEGDRTALLARRQAVFAAWSEPSARPDVVRRLTHVLGECGMVVAHSLADSGEETSGLLAASVRDLAQRMVRGGAALPALWRLDLTGSWSGLVASLDRVAAASWFVLPVGIRIAPTAAPNDFEVTLWLWI